MFHSPFLLLIRYTDTTYVETVTYARLSYTPYTTATLSTQYKENASIQSLSGVSRVKLGLGLEDQARHTATILTFVWRISHANPITVAATLDAPKESESRPYAVRAALFN